MSLKLCPIQEECQFYESGDNKPPNHHVRKTVICPHWLKLDWEICQYMSYVAAVAIEGKDLACDINKVKK